MAAASSSAPTSGEGSKNFPPRRGLVMFRIVENFTETVVSVASKAGEWMGNLVIRSSSVGGSVPPTPPATPYNTGGSSPAIPPATPEITDG